MTPVHALVEQNLPRGSLARQSRLSTLPAAECIRQVVGRLLHNSLAGQKYPLTRFLARSPPAALLQTALIISCEQSSVHPLLSVYPAIATMGSLPVSCSTLRSSAAWPSMLAGPWRSPHLLDRHSYFCQHVRVRRPRAGRCQARPDSRRAGRSGAHHRSTRARARGWR